MRLAFRKAVGIRKPVGCKTDGERALSNARSPNCVRLETEDRATFAAKIAPLVLVQTHEQRQVWHSGIGAGAIERLFEGEGHPLVKFVVEGAYGHVAAGAGASGSGFSEIVGIGLVGAIHAVEGPTGITAFRIRPKPTG